MYDDATADMDAEDGRIEREERRLAGKAIKMDVLRCFEESSDQLSVRDLQQALQDRSPDQVAAVVWSMINGRVLAYNADRTLRIEAVTQ